MDEKQSDGDAADRPLRIAMVVPPWYELPPPGYGGLEQVCSPLVDGLVGRGHQVTLFGAGMSTGTRAQFVATVAEPQYARIGQAMPELLHVCRVNQALAEGSFDVVHDHTLTGLATAALRPVPTVATVHGCPTDELGDYLSCLQVPVPLVAISHAQRRLNPGLPWATTIHHGLPVDPAGAGHDHDGPVLWLARFSPDKGPDLAVHACRAAGLSLTLAGKCDEPREKRYLDDVVRPLLGPDVTLTLNPDRSRCAALLREARCLLLPLRWEEPFGLVMIEAMASGTPVVALRRGSVPEVVRHGETGLVCDDPADLPGALRDVVDLDAASCVRHVRTAFSPETMVRGYERVYLAHTQYLDQVTGRTSRRGRHREVYDHIR